MDSPVSKRRRVADDVAVSKRKKSDRFHTGSVNLPSETKPLPPKLPPNAQLGRDCPYMHTINCEALDFDFEKVCSVSLESHNVYACLVCGKYFQGRGPSSHAFAHALDASHPMFLNLQTEAAYSLPDNLQIIDPVIDKIAFALRPHFTPESVAALVSTPREYRTLNGERHLQGVTALDNLQASDYANVVFQVLLCVTPLRNYLLLTRSSPASSFGSKSPQARLLAEFASLAQKIWNPHAFRGHVSPHEVMQSVASASGGRFGPLRQADPTDFFAWFIHTLDREIARACKKRDNVVAQSHDAEPGSRRLLRDCFQGKVEVTSRTDQAVENGGESVGTQVSSRESPFWFLSLDLPPKALFKDASERTLVAQVGLQELLAKYDGSSEHHVVKTGERLSFRLQAVPQFLMLTLRRVTKTKFATENNHAVVHCPVNGLDMSEFLQDESRDGVGSLLYSLIAIVIHDGPHDNCRYRVAVRHSATSKWFSIDNLTVTEVLPQVVSLSDTCMLLYERQ